MPNDITSFHPNYISWGPERKDRPDILYQYTKNDHLSPTYTPETWYDDDRIIIDLDNRPVKKWLELPLVISSEFEGFMMEGIRRLNGNITIRDFRARMPKSIPKGSGVNTREVYGLSTLGMRMSRFRLKACCIAWSDRDGGDSIKDYFDKLLPENCHAENSTKNFRDLTAYETAKAVEPNKGVFSSRAGSKALDEETRQLRKADHEKRLMKLKEKHDAAAENPQADLESLSSSRGVRDRDRRQKVNRSQGGTSKQGRKRRADTSSDTEKVMAPMPKRRRVQLGTQELNDISQNPIPDVSQRQSRKRPFEAISDLDSDTENKRQRRDSVDMNPTEYPHDNFSLNQPAYTHPYGRPYPTSPQPSRNATGYDPNMIHPSFGQEFSAPQLSDEGYIQQPSQYDEWSAVGNWDSSTLLNDGYTDDRSFLMDPLDPSSGYKSPLLNDFVVPEELEAEVEPPIQMPESDIIDSDFSNFAENLDFSNIAPSNPWEEESITAALHYTREDFRRLVALEPPITCHQSSYDAQYNHIQQTLASIWDPSDTPPALVRLEPWGTSFDNWNAPVAGDGTS